VPVIPLIRLPAPLIPGNIHDFDITFDVDPQRVRVRSDGEDRIILSAMEPETWFPDQHYPTLAVTIDTLESALVAYVDTIRQIRDLWDQRERDIDELRNKLAATFDTDPDAEPVADDQ